MDYKNQSGDINIPEQDFFTAGVGNASPSDNSFEVENNLNLSNDFAAWDAGPSERTNRAIGNQAIASSGDFAENDSFQPNSANQMGEIVEISPLPPESPQTGPRLAFDNKQFRTKGDHLNKGAIVEIDKAKRKFEQTGNAADFYDEVRNVEDGMMSSNLKNSYDRKVAAWQTNGWR